MTPADNILLFDALALDHVARGGKTASQGELR